MAQSEIQKLIKAFMSDDEQVRKAALFAQALKDKDKVARRVAAKALGKIGPAAKAAVPALTEALKDKDEDVRREAAKALKKLQGKE